MYKLKRLPKCGREAKQRSEQGERSAERHEPTLAIQSEAPVQVTPYMLNASAEAIGPDYAEEVKPEDEDTDFEAWGFREKEE